MKNTYYALPLNFSDIIDKKPQVTCSLKASIAQNAYLILTTHFGESRYDPKFGCLIWDQDFEILVNIKWKDNVRLSLEEAVQLYEKRLTRVKVKVDADEFEYISDDRTWIKKRLSIWITGTLLKTNEKFEFLEHIYLSPMSID